MSIQQSGVVSHLHKALGHLHDAKMVDDKEYDVDHAIGHLMQAMDIYHDAGAEHDDRMTFAQSISEEIADEMGHQTLPFQATVLVIKILQKWEKYKPKLKK